MFMVDYEYVFATTLHQKLKEKIIGKIYVTVTIADELLVKIESFNGLTYKFIRGNFSESILHGFSTDFAVYEIVTEYKKFIMKKYFV